MANNDRKKEEKKKREDEKARLRSREEELVRERNEMLRNTDTGDRLRDQQQQQQHQGPQGGLAASMHHPSRDVDMDRPENVPSGEFAGRHMPGAVSIHDTGVYPKGPPSSKAAPKGNKPGGHDMAHPRDDRGRKQAQSRKRHNLKLQHGGGPGSAQAPDMATSMVLKMADNATNFQDALPVNTSAGGGRQDHFQTPMGPNAVFHRARPEASYQVLKELAKRDPTNRGVVNNLSWTSNMDSRKSFNKKYAAGTMKSLLANTASANANPKPAARPAAVDTTMGNTSDASRAPASTQQEAQGLSSGRCLAFDGSAGDDDGLPFGGVAVEVPATPASRAASFVCPNCKLPGHRLVACVVARAVADGVAFVPGCPIHNSMGHNLDVCREVHKLSVDEKFGQFVVERQNMPPLQIDWFGIVMAYYRQGPHTQRWEPMPWTPAFCREVVDRDSDALMEAQKSRNLSTMPVDPASQTLRALFEAFPSADWPLYLRAEFEPVSQTNAQGQIQAPARCVGEKNADAGGNTK